MSLETNTTWRLVDDLEQIREHLQIHAWQVFGGSWGSALALAYAQSHPERVTELVLRGIFMLRPSELRWFYQDGASHLLADKWEDFIAPIPPHERHDLITAYRPRLNSLDAAVRVAAARAWARWEGGAITLRDDAAKLDQFDDPDTAVAFARIENHYFTHNGWFEPDQLLVAVVHPNAVPRVHRCRIEHHLTTPATPVADRSPTAAGSWLDRAHPCSGLVAQLETRDGVAR